MVCGLRDEATQKRLLSEADLTLDSAIQLAQSLESAGEQVKKLKEPETQPLCHMKPSAAAQQGRKATCVHCGRHPEGTPCRFAGATCHRCGEVGHIAPVCPNRTKRPPLGRKPNFQSPRADQVSSQVDDEDSLEEPYLYNIHQTESSSPPIWLKVEVNQKPLKFELDTGAAVSVISDITFKAVFPDLTLSPSNVRLRTYTDEAVTVLGELHNLTVRYQSQCVTGLSLIVVKGHGVNLLGRNWLRRITLNWSEIRTINQYKDSVESLLTEYGDVFADGLGTITGFTAKLHVPEGTRPKFCKPRTVPFAIREAVEEELARLERTGVIERVTNSDWAAPIVCVPKRNGKIRVCGDYKVTVNSALDVDQYPLPRPDEIFAKLAGGKSFTVLDLSHAYNQLLLDEESQKYVTVNTHRGLYRYKRLPFGIASAPAIFQRVMDTILQDLPEVMCYLDDIIITSKTDEGHWKNLRKVLERLRQHGIHVNKEKCEFMQGQVEYLGHKIDREGIHATDRKMEAIILAPTPKSVQELRSFLGLLNYYGKFIPNLATLIHPLNKLLCKDQIWQWSKACDESFKLAKEKLISPNLLVHYDPSRPIKLAGDASAYGIGAVISHVMPDGSERPIAYASHTLSSSERNYAQIEKEALSLIFGVKKFHRYLYGRKFVLVTDHKPLTSIFGPKRGIPEMAAARLQRWAIILSAYSYEIEFRPTDQHANADGLSRLPLSQTVAGGTSSEPRLFNVSQMESLPVGVPQLRQATRNDRVLSEVLRFTQSGWPKGTDVKSPLHPYSIREHELTVEEGCLLWGLRVVVPAKLRRKLLEELHRDHPGITRMKQVARSYMWWPGIDQEIEQLARSCSLCLAVKHKPPVAPLHPWEWPSRPWQRVHLDFAGPFQGSMFLVCVDAHSKWPEVHIMQSTTTTKTLEVLRQIFSSYGLPEQIVTDNGPQFISEEFAMFAKGNGIKHTRTAPYHPASNGLAERFVQSLKISLKTTASSGRSLSHRVSSYLLSYRSAPHATTGVAPCTLFLRRCVRTRFDLLRPNCQNRVMEKQALQKDHQDRHCRDRSWFVGERVMVRNLRPGLDWIPGVIIERLGPVTYLVDVNNNQIWKRHADQLKSCSETPPSLDGDPEPPMSRPREPAAPLPEPDDELFCPAPPSVTPPVSAPGPTVTEPETSDSTPDRRYPSRNRQPTDFYTPGVYCVNCVHSLS